MAQKRRLEVIIAGNASGLRGALGEVEGFGRKVSGVFRGLGRAGLIGLGGLGAGAAGGLGLALGEAREAEKIGRITDQLVKSSGGAAGLTGDQVAGLSEKLSGLVGVDDELIQANANVLLGFKNVKEGVGAGNDVFSQTLGLAQDMSTVMGTDAKSATLALGKALNDPIAGMTALGRSGVQFSDAQKEQIKQFVESGDLLSAQKVILGEVSSEFGGAAKAAADPLDRLKVIAGNLMERLGKKLLPVAEKLANWLGENLPKAFDAAAPFLDKFGAGVAWLSEKIGEMVRWVQANWPQISATIGRVLDQVRGKVQVVIGWVMTFWERFGDEIMSTIRAAWDFVVNTVTAAVEIVRGIIKVVTNLIQGDWGAVWDGIKQVVSGVWNAITGVVGFAINLVKNAISAGLELIKGLWSTAWEWVSREVREAVGGFGSFISRSIDNIVGWFTSLPTKLLRAGAGMWDWISDTFKAAINKVIGWWNDLEFKVPKIHITGTNIDVGGNTIGFPDLPFLAQGGTAIRSGWSVVGDDGPELLHMDRGATVVPLTRSGCALGGGQTINLTVQVTAPPGADRQWLRWLADQLAREVRDGGPLGLALKKATA